MTDDPATHWLTVLPGGWRLPVRPGQTLLLAALDGGVRLARSCRNGTCRTCLARVVSGQAHHTIDWPALLAEEKVDGWILPCVAAADGDLTIEAPGATELPPRARAPSRT
ncbi:MAG TPA: 2Fe-2S iron-sulfur cluster-binding protein [Aquabacterium sp.]|nr:2Fe-2S iron-sulfur cluster-binding protein [Aquabacterium sp.]HQC98160.1 2Fe-2S iron-sulfur cluster-binding protein [Aquabacterium sp.]